jgi:hypothetical protein
MFFLLFAIHRNSGRITVRTLEAHGDFIRGIDLMFDPGPGAIEQITKGHRNFVKGRPRLRPLVRNLPAHRHTSRSMRRCRSLMNFSAGIATAAKRPVLAAHYVFLLGFVQLAPVGDMRGDQLAPFFGRERRGVVGFGEKIAHRLVPEQARVRLADDFIEPRIGVLPFHFLILQQHRVLDWPSSTAHKSTRTVADGDLQRFVGNECTDQGAIERLGHAPQGGQLYRAFLLGLFDGGNGGLLDVHALSKLCRRHAKRLAHGFDPSACGRGVAFDRSQLLEAFIKRLAGFGGRSGLIRRL